MSQKRTLDFEAVELFENISDIQTNPGLATVVPKGNWSDLLVKDFCGRVNVPRQCSEQSVQRAVLIRYINFHCGGIVAKGFKTFDIIAAAILIMPTEFADKAADLLFPVTSETEAEGKENLFNLLPTSAPGEESRFSDQSATALSIISNYGTITQLDTDASMASKPLPGSSRQADIINPLLHDYTTSECESFLSTARATLEATDATSAQGLGMIQLRRICGYLALTLVRSIIKDKSQMAAAFSKTNYRRGLLSLMTKEVQEGAYSPPCTDAIKKAQDAFLRSHRTPRVLFAYLVMNWMNFHRNDMHWGASILAATCLTHTAYNGLQVFHMLTEVSLHFSLDWISIGSDLYFNSTSESWKRILIFMKTYLRKDAMQMAYPWARIIDDTYLMEFSAKSNFHLCAILAGILEIAQGNSGIWEANWVNTKMSEVEDAKLISRAFCEKHSLRLEDVIASQKSQGILDRAKAIKKREIAANDFNLNDSVGMEDC